MVAGLCTALELNSNPPSFCVFMAVRCAVWKAGKWRRGQACLCQIFCKEKSLQNLLKGEGILYGVFNSLINSILLVFAADYLREL